MNGKGNMAICSLSSGSCGNSYVLMSRTGALLIDAGISAKQINLGLEKLGLAPDDLEAVLLTHEHEDHIRGLKVFMKNTSACLYATRGTLSGLEDMGDISCRTIRAGDVIEAAGMKIKPFTVSHDAAEPVGYVAEAGSSRLSLVIDTGVITEDILNVMRISDLIVLEANHDESVLRVGRYPWFLKQRILSETGHLSNDAAANAAARSLKERCEGRENVRKRIVLAQVSKENNFPEMAETTVTNVLVEEGLKPGEDFTVNVLPRAEMSPVFEI